MTFCKNRKQFVLLYWFQNCHITFMHGLSNCMLYFQRANIAYCIECFKNISQSGKVMLKWDLNSLVWRIKYKMVFYLSLLTLVDDKRVTKLWDQTSWRSRLVQERDGVPRQGRPGRKAGDWRERGGFEWKIPKVSYLHIFSRKLLFFERFSLCMSSY